MVFYGVSPKDIRHSVKDLDLRVYETWIRSQSHKSNHIKGIYVGTILKQFTNHFRDFFVLLRVFYEAWSVDDGQRKRDVEVLVVVDVVDGDAILLCRSLLNQLEAERVVTLDVEDVVDHGVDQCRFARSGDAHQQNRFVLNATRKVSFAESETVDFGSNFTGFSERHGVMVQSVVVTDLLTFALGRFDEPIWWYINDRVLFFDGLVTRVHSQ